MDRVQFVESILSQKALSSHQFTHSPHLLFSTLLCRKPVCVCEGGLDPATYISHTMLSSSLEVQSFMLAYNITPHLKTLCRLESVMQ